MRPNYLIILFAAFLSFTAVARVNAQSNTGYITISGEVRDADTKKKLEYVSVSVLNSSISTVTNTDGAFSIKIGKSSGAEAIVFSHLGYDSQKFTIKDSDMHDVKILLSPSTYALEGVSIGAEALSLVTKAIGRIKDNYSPNVNMLTGFYRETIKKRSSYINISEAITYTYKSPYDRLADNDRAQIYKGRQLLSPKASDTLLIKLQGGPVALIYLDAVKAWDLFTDPETLTYYKYTMSGSVMIDGRAHHVVSFRPQVIVPYALLYGKMYIDEQTLTFTKIEANLSMDNESKATSAMLKRKPGGLRFKPEGLRYEVSYKRQGATSYLSYVRSELSFKCDWKRKLFQSSYLIVSEMVTTDIQDQDVARIPARVAFNEKYSLSDKVASFYDENFWEDYNIIEPTESLESAVSKLRKKLE